MAMGHSSQLRYNWIPSERAEGKEKERGKNSYSHLSSFLPSFLPQAGPRIRSDSREGGEGQEDERGDHQWGLKATTRRKRRRQRASERRWRGTQKCARKVERFIKPEGRKRSGAADRISRSSIGWMDMRPTEDGPKTLEESFF